MPLCQIARLLFRLCVLATLPLFVATASSAADETEQADKTEQADQPSLAELRAGAAKQSRFLRDEPAPSVADAPEPDLDTFTQEIRLLLQAACFDCHSADVQEGNLRLDNLDPNLATGNDIDWWIEVQAVLTNEEMPPPDAAPLADDDRARIIQWLAGEIQTASTLRRHDRSHSSFRRLTRYEFNYALQDLLGVPWNFARDLPPEAHSEDGFENSSELLHLSVRQLETYRRLARRALQRTTVTGDPPPTRHWSVTMQQAAARHWPEQQAQLDQARKKFKDDPEKLEAELERLEATFQKPPGNTYYLNRKNQRAFAAKWNYRGAKFAFAPTEKPAEPPALADVVAILPRSRQTLTVELGNQVPDDGILRVRVRAARVDADRPPPSLELLFGWQASNEGRALLPVGEAQLVEAAADAPRFYQWDVPLGDVYPRNSVRKTARMGGLPSPSEYIRFRNASAHASPLQIDYVEVATPVNETWPPVSHRRIFSASENAGDESAYAREILQTFMPRAWRRTIDPAELERKLDLFHRLRPQCDHFEQAIVEVLATVLASPHFLYVVHQHDTDRPQLSDEELATRLSLFLWCSLPDQSLRQLAQDGRLSEPEVLAAQVDRMLDDPRSERFSRHFVQQWLNLELLQFVDFRRKHGGDPTLKEVMLEEPVAFFHEVLKHDHSVLDFLHADYVVVNERLAKHYGWPHIHGPQFRRVNVGDDFRRGGLLTQAGLLAMNSDGDDSHPLKRGIWLLERILNDPPPPPPPAVPEIDLADPRIAQMTLKERIEDHRNHAACRSCHAKIDPWGIAFENYDALGRWRNQIEGKPVDASSRLFNDQRLEGMDGLKRFLIKNRQDQFVRAMVHKLATYALGRPLTFADHGQIDAITAAVRREGDGLATLIRHLTASELFQRR